MDQPLATDERGTGMNGSTVLICAGDPAERALARMSFDEPGWYVFECGFGDIAQVARSVKVDAVIVINNTSSSTVRMIRDTFASAGSPIHHVLHVRRAHDARAVAAAALER